MSWLYACTIYPLQLFYKYVYLACVRVTGSYGIGLIGLSLCCAVAFVPLGRMALNAKKREDLLQDIMQPQLDRIKDESTGAARQERIAKLYRRYGYHPLMSLRSAIGVLLQFPFLTAAYRMVQELTVLKGQPFWFITDLSVPDGLWNGVNALPIVMTLINFATVATAPNMRGKERVQAIVLALLFLWLLYDAPSALLVYWTCNNLNYLAQNFVFHDKKEAEKSRLSSCNFFSGNELALGDNGRTVLNVSFFVLLALAVSFFVFEIREVFDAFAKIAENDKTYLNVAVRRLYRCALLVCLFSTLFFFKRLLEQKFSAREVLLKALLSGISFAALFFFTHHYLVPIGVPNINGGKFTLFLLCIVVYSLLTFVIGRSYSTLKLELERALGGQEHRIYFGSVFVAVLLMFAFCESELYYSDPSFFTESLPKLLLGLAPYAIGVLVLAVALFFIVPHGMKLMLAVMALFAVIILMLNNFVFSGNYGSLDVTMLSAPQALYSKQNWYKDIGVLLIAATFVSAVLKFRLVKVVCKILVFVCLSLGIFSGYAMFSTRFASQSAVSKQTHNLLPDFHDRLWGFSKEGKNVIVFFWDMFTGGHMQEILAKRPELKKELSGFVWYPDTVAVGSNTFISSPSLFGGSAFAPQVLNQDETASNSEKLHKAYAILPNAFLARDYDVVVAGAPYEDLKIFQAHLVNNDALLLPDGQWEKGYVDYWLMMHDRTHRVKSNEMTRYLLTISLFKCAPSSLRASYYDNGSWHGLAQEVAAVTAAGRVKDLAPLQYMSTFSNVNAPKSTFKLIYSGLSHFPWHLPEDSLIPVSDPYPVTKGQFKLVDGIIPEHIFTENHMISFLASFCKWLKKEGIFDNTRIIVVSDHDESDSKMLNEALGGFNRGVTEYEQNKLYPGRVHALMMFKDFNCSEDLKVSSALVSTEDTPAMALKSLIKSDYVPDSDELEKLQNDTRRVRYHASGPWRPSDHGTNKFLISEYRVTGSIFKKDNWEHVESDVKNTRLTGDIDKKSLIVTDKMECLIHLFWGDETLYADGWAFLKGEDTKDTTVHLLIKRPDGSEFIYEARKVVGNDLVKWFKDAKYKYGRYEIALPKQLLGTGKHEVRCIVNKKYLSSVSKTIMIQ